MRSLFCAIFFVPLQLLAAPSLGTIRQSYADSVRGSTASQTTMQLELEAQAYGFEIPDRPQLSRSTLLKAGLTYESGRGDWGGKVDAFAGRYLDLKYSIFSVKEAYASFQSGEMNRNGGALWTWALGRKREFWSAVDQNWDLGLWEPKYLEEPLRPVDQGISGLLVSYQNSNGFEWSAFASPIFVPTMNPSLSEKNGDLVSESRWTRPPSSSAELIGTNTRLVYDLKIPDISSLVAKPGAGTRLSLGKNQRRGFWISGNFARKPINALAIKYDYRLAVSSTAGSAGEGLVSVSPTVNYHRLYGLDVGANYEAVKMSLSYLEDKPESALPKDDFSSDGIARTEWIQQAPQPLQVFGAHVEWQAAGILRDPIALKLDYLKANSSSTRDLNSAGEDKGSLIPNRLFFTNALQMKAEVLVFPGAKPLSLSFRYLRELDQVGSIYSVSGKFFATRSMAIFSGLDILGPDDGSEQNQDKRFLNSFRTNDRVYGGMSYVF